MAAIVRVESSFNPLAIGVVNARLVRQPQTLPEAIATARSLDKQGYRYSVGLAQIERSNITASGLPLETVFDPCTNLALGAKILGHCFEGAQRQSKDQQLALRTAVSCYYNGQVRAPLAHTYVQKVVAAAAAAPDAHAVPIPVVPALVAPDSSATPIPASSASATPAPPRGGGDAKDAHVF
jgi:type IV secretion system protein VirB1